MSKSFPTISNNHIYYKNPKENLKKPPWFIDCSRNDAEDILKIYQQYGNVLIRPNSSFPKNGSYALSAVTKHSGETKFVHYQITRTPTGFKLEVQSKPSPMPSLNDVLQYYVDAAGRHDHHALMIDPRESTSTKAEKKGGPANGAGSSRQYVNVNDSSEKELYLPMTGASNPHQIQRRVSAPTVTRDYVNLSRGTGRGRGGELNENEFDEESPREGGSSDYVNMNGGVRTTGRAQSLRNAGKSSSLSDDKVPSFRAPAPPLEPIYLQPSNADDSSDDT